MWRFQCPVQPDVWEGIRDAIKDCNICAQYDDSGKVVGDEDCLFLNVYSPKLPPVDQPLPVIVFFHGGGFIYGNGTDDTAHGPDFFMEKDVVMVTINYRLGVLGFLSLGTKEAPGNMGLRDQVLALQWVQNNISVFGGDQNNVTIYGISAGAASVEYLLLSPAAKGLFHKAIGQAGSSLLPWSRNENIKQLAFKIPHIKGNNITNTEELYKYLKGLPTKDLIEASMAAIMTEKWKGGLYFGFVPTTEKPGSWTPFLSVPPEIIIKSGNFVIIPYLTGTCSREGLLMTSFNKKVIEDLAQKKNFIDYLPFKFSDEEKADVENKLKAAYLETPSQYNAPEDPAIEFFSDVDFIGGVHFVASEFAKTNPNVYFYHFSYDGGLNYLKNKRNLQGPGACHGDEGGYLIKSEVKAKSITETDLKVRERMITMWTNFAKYG